MTTDIGRIGDADRAGGLRPEPAAQSQPEALIPCAWPLCGYAPGNYFCRCHHCDKQFEGDKRARECLDCAVASANFIMNDGRSKVAALAALNASLEPVLGALEQLLEVHDALGAGGSPSATRARRAIAQAIEARRAATVKQGAVEDESAVGSADAPTPNQDHP